MSKALENPFVFALATISIAIFIILALFGIALMIAFFIKNSKFETEVYTPVEIVMPKGDTVILYQKTFTH